ncbi:NAT_SF domain containing protein [uncultured Caudovirales phage]|uniref:NAT_SF domain containing protein n=1 Tax=uncultured Caudovirales phage TaxID=2100421 RepID=A0A6J5M467_9CAUD|nr:NAT_SF domain containing protein [uncultured Caudovirales phage]
MQFKIREVHPFRGSLKATGVLNQLVILHSGTFPYDDPVIPKEGRWWVARGYGDIVGFAGMVEETDSPGTWMLYRAGVLPGARGHGLQRALIRVRLAAAKRAGGTVAVSSTYFNNISANNLIREGFELYTPGHPWGAKGTLYWRKQL